MAGQKPQFDSQLGGSVDVPIEVNLMKFASARAQEIAALTMAVEDPQRSGLIFQKLPLHMRRRVMSHNAKRMPRKLREAHAQQMGKSKPGQGKRPSRKYRRRPANLLEEYNRRQRNHAWLETHIWHAKRFHMVERWGYRLANFPNDKSYRACYRATANHCLLQDVSFLCCVELIGSQQSLLAGLMQHTNASTGLTFGAQSLLDGKREGELMFYERNRYPYGAVGNLSFMWKPVRDEDNSDVIRTLWIWAHPAYYEQLICSLSDTFLLQKVHGESLAGQLGEANPSQGTEKSDVITGKASEESPARKKRRVEKKKPQDIEAVKLATRNVPFERTPKYVSECGRIKMILLKDTLNRFRLIGPLSHSVLQESLNVLNPDSDANLYTKLSSEKTETEEMCAAPKDIESIFSCLENNSKGQKQEKESKQSDNVIQSDKSDGMQTDDTHSEVWASLRGAVSPAQFTPHMILSLVVSDPRLQIPDKRTKAVPSSESLWEPKCSDAAVASCSGPVWSPDTRDKSTKSKLPTAKFNALRSKFLVPGVVRTLKGNLGSGNKNIVQKSHGNTVGIVAQHNNNCKELHSAKIPLMLVQRPGSRDTTMKRLGFGCGWDIIIPAGWAMPFWLAFVFRGARAGGLREAASHMLERGMIEFFHPDTSAGALEEERREQELRDTHFRFPPDKRPNFIKLGVSCPFRIHWNKLLRDWSEHGFGSDGLTSGASTSFFVLRDRKVLQQLADTTRAIWAALLKNIRDQQTQALTDSIQATLSSLPSGESCLIPVRIEAVRRGTTEDLSQICIPSEDDLKKLCEVCSSDPCDPIEDQHEDSAHDERKKVRAEHKKVLSRLARKRAMGRRKQKEEVSDSDGENTVKTVEKSGNQLKSLSKQELPTKDLVENHRQKMETLWLPDLSKLGSVKRAGSRDTAGFITRGDYSFTEAKGCALGYIASTALFKIVETWCKYAAENNISMSVKSKGLMILVRSPSSFQYRPASIQVLC